jgi:flagellar basal-body rod modification protein FlgD
MAEVTGVLTQSQIERLNEITKDRVNEQKLKAQTLDKDAFLKILTTQLQYQDPMSPMEDAEFIGQMAQFSSVEQLNTIGDQMEILVKSVEALSADSDDDDDDGVNQKILNELIKLNKAIEAYDE